MTHLGAVLAVSMCFWSPSARGDGPAANVAAVQGVTAADPADVERSVAALRDEGPQGLRAVLDRYEREKDPRLLPVIDTVAAQHDAVWSGLYWYTDIEKAKAAAQEQGKPILYLRLLGKLTDEYSCANSRFFRTVLYSNAEVSRLLRERFVLVWVSERPVPVVTIDYGDGRVLNRTITGNSVHYVLDSSGRVVDALPGLFDPVTFARILGEAADTVATDSDDRHLEYLFRSREALRLAWAQESLGPASSAPSVRSQRAGAGPGAAEAGRRAVSKTAVERPMIQAIAPGAAAAPISSVDTADEATWRRVAAAHLGDAALDPRSIAMIRSQDPAAYSVPGALDRTVEKFQRLVAEDSVRDNYLFRQQVLEWLQAALRPVAVEDLNRRVYSELFLTPASDPWLGLRTDGTYSALANDGCRVDASR